MAEGDSDPSWVRRATVLFAVGVALIVFFYFFAAVSTVLLGILAATIVACALNPLLARIPAPRGVGAGLVGIGLIAVAAGLILGFSLPLSEPIQRQFEKWPETKQSIDQLLLKWSEHLNIGKPMSSDELVHQVVAFFANTDSGSLLIIGVRDAVLAILLWFAFVFVGSIFLMASPRDVLLAPAIRVLPASHRAKTRDMLDALGRRLRWWMIGTLGGMLVVFSASAIGYSVARIKFAFPLALLAGLGEMVPTVGPATAAIVALLFAATQSAGAVFGVLLTYVIIQSLEAYLVLPLIMRGAVKIHPSITLFSVVLWAKVFGIPGLMLAIPINLVIGTAIEFLYVRPRDAREQMTAARNAAPLI